MTGLSGSLAGQLYVQLSYGSEGVTVCISDVATQLVFVWNDGLYVFRFSRIPGGRGGLSRLSCDDFNVKFNDLLSNIDGDRNSEHEYSVILDTTGNTNSYLL